MKQIVDLIPMAAFVLVFIWKDIFAATMALLVGLIIQIAIYKMARWEVQKYMYVILVIALASGGLTLILQDSMFIKLRSTIVSVFISILIGGSQFVGEKNILERLLGVALTLPRRAWRELAWLWVFVLMVNALLNIFITYQFSDTFWVSYRVASGFVVPIVLLILAAIYLKLTGQTPKLSSPSPSDSK